MNNCIKTHWPLAAVIFIFTLIRVIVIPHPDIITWDASVYVGMGKYLFSHGTVGVWESLRPVGLPIILGALWKLGIAPYTAGMVFSFLVSAAMLAMVYTIAEQARKGAGTIATVLLAATELFFIYSAIPVTDITSTFFAVLGLYLTYNAKTNKQYFIAGMIIALGLLFRFPQGLMLVVALLVIAIKSFQQQKGKWSDRIVQMIERCFVLGGGFFVIVVPFLVVNYYVYGNAFLPFIEGTAVVKLYPSLYQKGVWFYVTGLFKQDPLLYLALLPVGMLWKKAWRSPSVIATVTAFFIVTAYFVYQPHKELRYMLAFMPYAAVLAGIGIAYLLEWWKLPQLLFFGLFFITAFMLTAGMIVHPFHDKDAKALYAFNTYFDATPKARILSSTPYTLAYSNVLITRTLYDDWNDAYVAYNTLKTSNDYIALDTCNLELGCTDNSHCKDKKQALLDELNKQNTPMFSETTPNQCLLAIYKIQ